MRRTRRLLLLLLKQFELEPLFKLFYWTQCQVCHAQRKHKLTNHIFMHSVHGLQVCVIQSYVKVLDQHQLSWPQLCISHRPLANCGVLPRQTLFWNFCSRTLLFLPRGKLTPDSFSPLVEVEEVESPQSPAGTASSPLGCWGQTHIGNFCTGTREGRSPSSAPLSLMHSSVRRKGTALAWCWLF